MLKLIENFIGFFNVKLFKNELEIEGVDIVNNIVIVQQTLNSSIGQSEINSKIFGQEEENIPVLSISGN